MHEPENRLLKVGEVAAYLRVGDESIRQWLREGKLPGVNLGRGPGCRVPFKDLEQFIEERRTRSIIRKPAQ
jgi:excisionase family DNA binding protein